MGCCNASAQPPEAQKTTQAWAPGPRPHALRAPSTLLDAQPNPKTEESKEALVGIEYMNEIRANSESSLIYASMGPQPHPHTLLAPSTLLDAQPNPKREESKGSLVGIEYMNEIRANSGALLMCIRESAQGGVVYLAGAAATRGKLVDDVSTWMRSAQPEAKQEKATAAEAWDTAWRGAKMTNGERGQNSFFPNGKKVVGLLRTIARNGFVPTSAPKYGSSADGHGIRPMITFRQDDQYKEDVLFLAVKDIDKGKLCAAGPNEVISALGDKLTRRLNDLAGHKSWVAEHTGNPTAAPTSVGFDRDETEEAWDIVWQQVSTTWHLSDEEGPMKGSHFPKGHTFLHILEEVYELGYHLMAAPSFGNWPCLIFATPKKAPRPSSIIFAAVQNVQSVGKICIAGNRADGVAHRLLTSIQGVRDQRDAKVQQDENDDQDQMIARPSLQQDDDDDWDQVIRGVSFISTTKPFFLCSDTTTSVLETMSQLGWSIAACPLFGHAKGSWTSFVWQWDNTSRNIAFVAASDILRKVCLGGALRSLDVFDTDKLEIEYNAIGGSIVKGLKALKGADQEELTQEKVERDDEFAFTLNNAAMGKDGISPGGFPMEVLLIELRNRGGWVPSGGLMFEQGAAACPVLVFQKPDTRWSSETYSHGLTEYELHNFEGQWWDEAEKSCYKVVASSDNSRVRAFATSCSTLMTKTTSKDGIWMEGEELHANGLYIRKLRMQMERDKGVETGRLTRKIFQGNAWSTPAHLTRMSHQEIASQGKYLSFASIWKAMEKKDTVLVKGSWLVGNKGKLVGKDGKSLPRRQDLPKEAIWDFAELRRQVETYEVFIMALSYAWATPEHPDPEGKQVYKVASILEERFKVRYTKPVDGGTVYSDAAVFLDWCSLFQEKRTSDEKDSFRRGLRSCNLWYAHERIESWLLTVVPEGVTPYDERGWPTFEKAISSMITPDHMLFDIGKHSSDGASTWPHIYGNCKAGRHPPKAPELFNEELAKKRFTNGADVEMVQGKYTSTFNVVCGSVLELAFSNLHWTDQEAFVLAAAMPYCTKCEKIDLKSNQICVEGATAIFKAAAQCPKLQVISMTKNPLGDGACVNIAPHLPNIPAIVTIWFNECKVCDEGAIAMCKKLPSCKTIRNFYLFDNKLGASSANVIKEVLPKAPHLVQFGIGGNHLEDDTLSELQEAWKAADREKGARIYVR